MINPTCATFTSALPSKEAKSSRNLLMTNYLTFFEYLLTSSNVSWILHAPSDPRSTFSKQCVSALVSVCLSHFTRRKWIVRILSVEWFRTFLKSKGFGLLELDWEEQHLKSILSFFLQEAKNIVRLKAFRKLRIFSKIRAAQQFSKWWASK